MNAGCFGSETWQYVKAVKTIDHQGNVRVRSADDFCPFLSQSRRARK